MVKQNYQVLDNSFIDKYHSESELAKCWITLIDRYHSTVEFTKFWITPSVIAKFTSCCHIDQHYFEALFTKVRLSLLVIGITAKWNLSLISEAEFVKCWITLSLIDMIVE